MPEDIVLTTAVESDSAQESSSQLASELQLESAPDLARPIESAPPPIAVPQISPSTPRVNELWSLFVAATGWILPGAGYLLQRRWARAIVGFAGVAALAIIGLKMRGNVFPPHGTEPFDFLGFIADAGSGVFYFLAKNLEAAGPDVSRAAGDYGTRLIATAGILNLLLVLDAVEIARGEKS